MKKVRVTKRMLQNYMSKVLLNEYVGSHVEFEDPQQTITQHVQARSTDHVATRPGDPSGAARRMSGNRAGRRSDLSLSAAASGMTGTEPAYEFKGFADTLSTNSLLAQIGPGDSDGGPGEKLLGSYLTSNVVKGKGRNSSNSALFGQNSTK